MQEPYELKQIQNQVLDLDMDGDYTDHLYKQMDLINKEVAQNLADLEEAKRQAEIQGNDQMVIKFYEEIERLKLEGSDMFEVQKNPNLKSCVEKLREMQLTQEGIEMFVKKCEENGDYSVSKIRKKEEIAEALLENEIVQNERTIQRIEDEITSAKEQAEANANPRKHLKKIFPLLAIGGIIFLILKKDSI